MIDLLVFLIIGGAAGWLAGVFVKGRGFGLVGNVAVGVVGALLGGFLFKTLATLIAGAGGFVAAFAGAVVLLWGVDAVKRIQKP